MDRKYALVLTGVSLVYYLLSLLLYVSDPDLSQRWIVLFVSLIPIVLVFGAWVYSLLPHKKALFSVSLVGFFVVYTLSVVSRFYLLLEYPFVSVGDELRDGGLNALQIVTGEIKNIFSYGRYDSHGLIIPTITAPFYKVLGSSILVYRLPSAIISIASILILYVLLSAMTKNKLASFIGSLALVTMPLHLFHSRTEIVVILNSLLSPLMLFGLFVLFRRKLANTIDYIFLGTLFGFCFNFHSSIKAFAMVAAITVVSVASFFWCVGLVKIPRSWEWILPQKKMVVRQFVGRILLFGLFMFIGFGPKLINTPPSILFHTSRIVLVEEGQDSPGESFVDIVGKYRDSLLVWVSKPTSMRYPDHRPIFPLATFALMFVGLSVGFIKKEPFLLSATFIFLVAHLTNSALTDALNADHRLGPLYPIGAFFVGVGVAFILENIKVKTFHLVFAFVVTIFLIYQSVLFFVEQPANKNRDLGDYLSMHIIYFVKSNDNLFDDSNSLVLSVSENNYEKFRLMHYEEQYMYFFPNIDLFLKQDDSLGDHEVTINTGSHKGRYVFNCGNISYLCPIGYTQNMVINY